jgi:hypothetical protein
MALKGAPFKLCLIYRRSLVSQEETPAQAELGRGTPASLFSIA